MKIGILFLLVSTVCFATSLDELEKGQTQKVKSTKPKKECTPCGIVLSTVALGVVTVGIYYAKYYTIINLRDAGENDINISSSLYNSIG